MGKQKGTAERSKFKAASSSEFGNGQTGFFTGFGQEQLDQNLDPRLRVALRKISKKDATTKAKACEELLALLDEDEKDQHMIVSPLLIAWPRYYQKLVIENEPRVRSQSHKLTIKLIQLAGKQSAPYLKQIIPALIYGICDEYSISSTTCTNGFVSVFTNPEKAKSVILHVQKDIVTFCEEIIMKKPEKGSIESELEINRQISQALRCLAKYYDQIKTENKDSKKSLDGFDLTTIFDTKQFWKLSRHKEASIRSGFFQLGMKVLQKETQTHIDSWTKSIFSSLGENDPVCVRPLWASVLILLRRSQTDESVFESVNFLKAFVPGLWSMLRGGAFGCGSIIYPHMLPLIANIPLKLAQPPFFENFINNFREGQLNTESKIDLRHSITALFECLQYINRKTLVENPLEVIINILTVSICESDENQMKFSMIELAKPFFELLSKWKNKDEFEASYDKLYSGIYVLFTNIVHGYLDGNESESSLLKCSKFIKSFIQCNRNIRRGVQFKEAEGSSNVAESNLTELNKDICELVILLLKPLDQMDENLSKMYLIITIDVTENLPVAWKELLFSKISENFTHQVEPFSINERNELLMQKWMIPKLARALKSDVKKPVNSDLIVEVDTETDQPEIQSEEPEVHNFRLEKPVPKEDVLKKISSILLYLANSAKSCAEILNIVSDQPVKLLPLLKFISNQITKSKEEASQKLLEEYYQRLFNDKDAENYAECISVLLKCGPLALQEKICLDIGEEVEKVKNFEKFAKHVSIRLHLEDKSKNWSWEKMGTQWSKIISENFDIAEGTSDLLDLIYHNDEVTFKTITTYLIESILATFQTSISTDSFAAILELFARFRNTSESEETRDFAFIGNIFSNFFKKNFHLENLKEKMIPLLIIAGKSFVFDDLNEIPEFENKFLFTTLLVEKCCQTLSIKLPEYNDDASDLCRQFLSFSKNKISFQKEAWTGIKLTNIESLQNLGYLVFEAFIEETNVINYYGNLEDDKEFQTIPRDEAEFQMITSEILNENNIVSNCYKLSSSGDSSLLIGALAQVVELGIGNYSTADKANLATLITSTLSNAKTELTEAQWDFILCSITDWLESVNDTLAQQETSSNLANWALLANTNRALKVLIKFLNSPAALVEPSLPANLLDTWKEFFLPEISQRIFRIYFLLSSLEFGDKILIQSELLKTLEPVLVGIGLDELLGFDVPLKLSIQLTAVLPDNINSLCNHLYARLSNTNETIAVSAHHFLKLLLPKIISLYIKDTPEPPLVILENTWKILTESQYEFGSLCYTRSAVLAISLCLDLIIVSRNSNYLHYFLGSEHCSKILDETFVTLPKTISDFSNIIVPSLDQQLQNGSASFEIERWSLVGVNEIAKICPGAVRLWQKSLLNKNMQKQVQLYFTKFLSENIVVKELKGVKDIQALQCVPYYKSRSIMATYTMDDLQVEIMVTLPIDWPLSPPKIEGIKSVGVNSSEWRLWLFQLEQALATGAGLVAGLRRWSNYLQKKFDGIEECYICYSIIYGKGQQLPRLPCKTCGKKFHKECLYKWFSTSNNSTCPLCRSPMIFSQ